MLPDRVSNPGPLTYESGALPIALRGRADFSSRLKTLDNFTNFNICSFVFYHFFVKKTLSLQGSISVQTNLICTKIMNINTVQILCIGTDRSQANSADQDQTASEEAV